LCAGQEGRRRAGKARLNAGKPDKDMQENDLAPLVGMRRSFFMPECITY